MAIYSKNGQIDMSHDARFSDWLEEIRELNWLFLTYLRAIARDGRGCMGLSARVVCQLREAEPEMLERLSTLPTALFHVNVDPHSGTRHVPRPTPPTEQMRLSLALTILNSAWHMARSGPFEARTFLHLSARDIRCLRATPLSRLPSLATSPAVLTCAFAGSALTWPALVRNEPIENERMLILIALQPAVVPGVSSERRCQAGVRSARQAP